MGAFYRSRVLDSDTVSVGYFSIEYLHTEYSTGQSLTDRGRFDPCTLICMEFGWVVCGDVGCPRGRWQQPKSIYVASSESSSSVIWIWRG